MAVRLFPFDSSALRINGMNHYEQVTNCLSDASNPQVK